MSTQTQSQVLGQLQQVAQSLYVLSQSTDPNVSDGAAIEYISVHNRVATLLGLQLDADTDAMKAQAQQVTTATVKINAVLATVKVASDIISGVTTFLQVVDAFLQVAKIAALA